MVADRAYALLGAGDVESNRELHAVLVKSVNIDADMTLAELGSLEPGANRNFEGHAQLIHASTVKMDSDGKVATDSGSALYYGAMLYRQTEYKSSAGILGELVERLSSTTDPENEYVRCTAEYFLAMARHDLGHDIQAQRLFQQAVAKDNVFRSDPRFDWRRRVALDALRRESTNLIGDAPSRPSAP